jgi:hypothetical protein
MAEWEMQIGSPTNGPMYGDGPGTTPDLTRIQCLQAVPGLISYCHRNAGRQIGNLDSPEMLCLRRLGAGHA